MTEKLLNSMNASMAEDKETSESRAEVTLETFFIPALYQGYAHFMEESSDPRVSDLPLMSCLWQTTLLCMLYLIIVKWVGPLLMRDRKPFEVKRGIMVYNILQTAFNGWAFWQIAKLFIWRSYSFHCQPVDYSSKPEAVHVMLVCYFFFLSKFADWMDSFFFVARKKFGHLSFLHVVHHVFVPWCCWFGVKFVAGGHGLFGIMFNSLVHTIMYSYYFLSAWGVSPKYLWWKRYLTSLQMIQFVAVFLHSLQPLFFDCDFPKSIALLMIFNCVLFWFLFSAFYKKSYVRKDGKIDQSVVHIDLKKVD